MALEDQEELEEVLSLVAVAVGALLELQKDGLQQTTGVCTLHQTD